MSVRDILLALVIVLVWGFNFVVMKAGLEVLPPFLFAFLRFAFAAIPLVFFYRRPAVPWRLLWSYAFAQFTMQYAFLFVGLKLGMTAGLSSAVIQVQAFFTIGLGIAMLGEVPRRAQLYASALAIAGLGVIAWHVEGSTTLIGLLLVIIAALAWAFGNIYTRRIALSAHAEHRKIEAMSVVAWGSLLATIPLLALSLLFEGPTMIMQTIRQIEWRGAGAVLFNAYATTTLGFGAWSYLMGRYSTATVAPFALLVPIVGMTAAALILGETMHAWLLIAAALVVAGLAINQFSGRSTLRGMTRSST
jgi:O-acetylserine/cysteine efflux transporter